MPRLLSPFRYYGSKARLMPHIIPLFPAHKLYVSVFGGSGADISHKPYSASEVYNDANENLATFFRVVQDRRQYAALVSLVAGCPLSRDILADCHKIIRCGHRDPVKRAFAMYYNSFLSYSGLDAGTLKRPSLAVSSTKPVPQRWRVADRHLWDVRRRFRNVFVENRPWESLVNKYDGPETLFYLDPPYLHSTRVSPKAYALEMSTEQHKALLVRLQTLQGYAVLSGYDSELYAEMLNGWRSREFATRCTASMKHTPRVEVVWMNYDSHGNRLAV